ncbi:MAG: dihydrodipicolinate synthase family protein [Planctomycetes bacterium]|nr:dihydrodipicolinate synthase family protein [Planctomycetota bacterium]
MKRLEGIVGVKDSGGDMVYFENLVKLRKYRPDWTFFAGPEHLLVQAVRLGGNGGVNGGANVFPRLFVETYKAAAAGNESRLNALQEQIEYFQNIYAIGKYASRFIKGTKCALSVLGICDDFMGEPFHRFRSPERKRVIEIMEKSIAQINRLLEEG